MKESVKISCFFCGLKTTRLPIGIAFGSGGYDYSFCKKCLDSMTAEQFWKKLTHMIGIAYPLKLKK